MSYEPTTWKDGDLVTSAKLNKLEQGVANGGGNNMVGMTIEENVYTVDKTWQEIWDNNYNMIYLEDGPDGKMFFQIEAIDPSDYSIYIVNQLIDFSNWLVASSANEYPTFGGGGK